MSNFTIFLNTIGNVQMVVSFIDNGSLNTALSAIGDTTLASAQQELSNLRHAKNKRETVNRAATQLRIALTAYFSQNKAHRPLMQRKVFTTTMALTMCYIYLREWVYADRLFIEVANWLSGITHKPSALDFVRGSLGGDLFSLGKELSPSYKRELKQYAEFRKKAAELIVNQDRKASVTRDLILVQEGKISNEEWFRRLDKNR